jgi:hypothetical protein
MVSTFRWGKFVIQLAAALMISVIGSARAVEEHTAGFVYSACRAFLDCAAKPTLPWCNTQAPANQTAFKAIGFCHGFIIAAMVGHPLALTFNGLVRPDAALDCAKSLEQIPIGEYVRTFVEYVDAHPETRSQHAFGVASRAFQSKFPCR